MSALVLDEYHDDLSVALEQISVRTRPVPTPKRGQVLVRIEAAPCNPSDELFLRGMYGIRKPLPAVPGWEGAGTVVKSGGGIYANRLVGKRVACGGQSQADGTWAEYYLCDALSCVPLPEQVSVEQGATLLVNPLTALSLRDLAKLGRHKAIVQTAAASQVGLMVIELCRRAGIETVNVVRREEQRELLIGKGARHVLVSEGEGYLEEIGRLCHALHATMAFEAVAGRMTGDLLRVMPEGAEVVVYGALSGEECQGIDPIDVIFRGKKVSGFYLGQWIRSRSFLKRLKLIQECRKAFQDRIISTVIREVLPPEKFLAALRNRTHMTDGKILLSFSEDSSPTSR
jgi:NADPH:quinone reductase